MNLGVDRYRCGVLLCGDVLSVSPMVPDWRKGLECAVVVNKYREWVGRARVNNLAWTGRIRWKEVMDLASVIGNEEYQNTGWCGECARKDS